MRSVDGKDWKLMQVVDEVCSSTHYMLESFLFSSVLITTQWTGLMAPECSGGNGLAGRISLPTEQPWFRFNLSGILVCVFLQREQIVATSSWRWSCLGGRVCSDNVIVAVLWKKDCSAVFWWELQWNKLVKEKPSSADHIFTSCKGMVRNASI